MLRTYYGLDSFQQALASGWINAGDKVNLSFNHLDPEGVKHIAEALKSGECPQGLSIDLSDNDLGLEGAKPIADALKSGECPQGLSIDLSDNELGPEGAKHIADAVAQAIEDKSLPYGVCIRGVSNEILSMLETYNKTLKRNVKILSHSDTQDITGLLPELRQMTASFIDPGLAAKTTFFKKHSTTTAASEEISPIYSSDGRCSATH